MKRPPMQIGLGIALGAGIGIALSVAIGTGAAWLGIGIPIGILIGWVMSKKKTEPALRLPKDSSPARFQRAGSE